MKAALLACIADLAPDLEPGALAEIAASLSPLEASPWPDIAWRFSRLTPDGFPVEFAFSTRDDALRLTVEPSGPEADRGCAPGPQAQPLRWGTWLGLRQDGMRVQAKRYQEAAGRTADGVPGWLARRLRMTSVDADSSTEAYYDLSGALPAQLQLLLAGWGVDLRDRLQPQLEACWGRPLGAGLKFIGLGCSHRRDADGRTRAVALFFRAAAVPGVAARVRDLILAGAAAVDRPHAAYRRLWSEIPAAALPDHGIISLIDAPGRPLEVRCGISGRAVLDAHAALLH